METKKSQGNYTNPSIWCHLFWPLLAITGFKISHQNHQSFWQMSLPIRLFSIPFQQLLFTHVQSPTIDFTTETTLFQQKLHFSNRKLNFCNRNQTFPTKNQTFPTETTLFQRKTRLFQQKAKLFQQKAKLFQQKAKLFQQNAKPFQQKANFFQQNSQKWAAP